MYVRCAKPNSPILDQCTNRSPSVHKFHQNSEMLSSHSLYTHSPKRPPSQILRLYQKTRTLVGRHRKKKEKKKKYNSSELELGKWAQNRQEQAQAPLLRWDRRRREWFKDWTTTDEISWEDVYSQLIKLKQSQGLVLGCSDHILWIFEAMAR